MRDSPLWPEFSLDRSAAAPAMRQQIAMQLAAAIRMGRLHLGSRVPSSRCLARMLGVSRGTVVDAYDSLLQTGILVAVAGSGVRVAHAVARVPNFSNLKAVAMAAHYPVRVCHFADPDGTALYLNVTR